jgi:AP-1 complex subunit mu
LDVVEKLNILVSSNGTVLHSEIIGSIQMKSFLSGMPELKLGLNDKLMFEGTHSLTHLLTYLSTHSLTHLLTHSLTYLLVYLATGRSTARIKSVELEDIKFHQCVRLARFENDRTISFIPPDGTDLLTHSFTHSLTYSLTHSLTHLRF